MSSASPRVVGTPSISSSPSARSAARDRRRAGPRPRRSASRSASRRTAGSSSPPRRSVSTRTPGPSGGRKRVDRPGRGREVARRILGVDPDLDRVARAAARARSATSGSPGGDAQLLAHDVDPGHELGDGMLDLEARVQLDEVEGAVRRRAGTRTCRRCGSRSRGTRARRPPPSPRASPASSAGEGDSSISFWWRRWIEHSRSPSVSTPPSSSQSTWISTWRAGTIAFST